MPPSSRGGMGLMSSLMGPKSAASFRPKEKYLIFLVLATFCFVCFGAIFFLPNTDSKSGEKILIVLLMSSPSSKIEKSERSANANCSPIPQLGDGESKWRVHEDAHHDAVLPECHLQLQTDRTAPLWRQQCSVRHSRAASFTPAGRHAQALHRSEHWRREHSFPHSVVVVLSARTARTAIQRLMDGAQSPRRIAPAMWSFKHCPARHNQVSGTAPAALLCSRRARAARRSRPTRRRSAHPSPSWSWSLLPFREAVRTAGGLGLPSARATFANSLSVDRLSSARSSTFGTKRLWFLRPSPAKAGVHSASTCVLTPLHCGGCPSMMYVRVCACVGQTFVVLCAGLGTEDLKRFLVVAVLPSRRCSRRSGRAHSPQKWRPWSRPPPGPRTTRCTTTTLPTALPLRPATPPSSAASCARCLASSRRSSHSPPRSRPRSCFTRHCAASRCPEGRTWSHSRCPAPWTRGSPCQTPRSRLNLAWHCLVFFSATKNIKMSLMKTTKQFNVYLIPFVIWHMFGSPQTKGPVIV